MASDDQYAHSDRDLPFNSLQGRSSLFDLTDLNLRCHDGYDFSPNIPGDSTETRNEDQVMFHEISSQIPASISDATSATSAWNSSHCNTVSQDFNFPFSLTVDLDSHLQASTSTLHDSPQMPLQEAVHDLNAQGHDNTTLTQPHFPTSSTPIDIPTAPQNFQDLGPFGRWRVSPPETEPIPESAIRDALAQSSYYDSASSYGESFILSPMDSNQAHSSKAASSTGSDTSFCSVGSRTRPSTPAPYIKRRRRQLKIKKLDLRPPAERRAYQCTFCTDTFKTKFDWQRHETTLHLSLERWQCCMSGPIIRATDGTMMCIFCEFREPTAEHLELHSYRACAAKSLESRSFYRKDHLTQHLRLFHNKCAFNSHMSSWVFAVQEIRSRCGFCDATMTTWAERAKHLARHFRKGADMKDWKGDRGFDDWANELVENDMPAYMIGKQRITMDPFSASQVAHRIDPLDPRRNDSPEGWSEDSIPNAYGLQSFRFLKRKLLGYIKEEIAQGNVPSDDQLRRKTSEIIYGPDNDWDPTWADDPECLDEVKREAGLVSLPLAGGKNAFIGRDKGES